MPVHIDPNIVKIAVELENHQAQLIEFDQKISLTSMYGSTSTIIYVDGISHSTFTNIFFYNPFSLRLFVSIVSRRYYKEFMRKLEFDGRGELCIAILRAKQ